MALPRLLIMSMNAILQHRGHRLMSVGQSIAVQHVNDNLVILALTSAYALALQARSACAAQFKRPKTNQTAIHIPIRLLAI